jgi:hypothetical protein
MIMGTDGARYQERLCWRGPAEIYWIKLGWKSTLFGVVTQQRLVIRNWGELVCAVIRSRLCELAKVLQLPVVTICKSSVNLITSINPMSIHKHVAVCLIVSEQLVASQEELDSMELVMFERR